MKTKVLICGATGFIGRNLTEQLSKRADFEVHAVRFKRPRYECDYVTWHQADLCQSKDIERIIEGMDIVIQAAATRSSPKEIISRPSVHVTDNAVMNSNLFRAAFESKVKHLLFFSCGVMYPSSETALKETDFNANTLLDPRYFGVGHTTLYLEKMCEFYANISDTKFTAIRYSNIYGAYDKFDLERSDLFGATVTKIMTAKDKIFVRGTGEEECDFLYADDLVQFVELAIENQPEKFRLYNCGYGQTISVKELVQKILTHSGKHLAIDHDLSQPTLKTTLFLDCELAKHELGWVPETTLDEGILNTLAWWNKNVREKVLEEVA